MSKLPVFGSIESYGEKLVAPALSAAPQPGRIRQYGSDGIHRAGGSGKYSFTRFGEKAENVARAGWGYPQDLYLLAFNKSSGGSLKSAGMGAENAFLSFISDVISPFSPWFPGASGNPAGHRRAVIHQNALSTPAAGCGEFK